MKEQSRGAAALKEAITGTTESPLNELLSRQTRSFDPDAWHVMQERDNALIRDHIIHGYASKDFVYSFDISGKKVAGISVVGARELASQYGGIKSKIMATVEKRGAMFIFRQFSPMSIEVRTIRELEQETDFYECVMEISDIKTGNSIEVRKKENRLEQRSSQKGGGWYERPHYDVIAESKAYRNGVLSILPQNVISEFEARCLNAGNTSKEKTIDQIREGIIAFSTKNGLHMNKQEVSKLSFAEISGLRESARDIQAFKEAATALGLLIPEEKKEIVDKETGEIKDKSSANSVTYAQCAQALNSSKTLDQLEVALGLISGVVDSKQQEELRELEKACRKNLSK
jgi:hypothetical protein